MEAGRFGERDHGGSQGTLGDDGNIHFLDCGNSLMVVHICQILPFKYSLLYVDYSSAKLFKKFCCLTEACSAFSERQISSG